MLGQEIRYLMQREKPLEHHQRNEKTLTIHLRDIPRGERGLAPSGLERLHRHTVAAGSRHVEVQEKGAVAAGSAVPPAHLHRSRKVLGKVWRHKAGAREPAQGQAALVQLVRKRDVIVASQDALVVHILVYVLELSQDRVKQVAKVKPADIAGMLLETLRVGRHASVEHDHRHGHHQVLPCADGRHALGQVGHLDWFRSKRISLIEGTKLLREEGVKILDATGGVIVVGRVVDAHQIQRVARLYAALHDDIHFRFNGELAHRQRPVSRAETMVHVRNDRKEDARLLQKRIVSGCILLILSM